MKGWTKIGVVGVDSGQVMLTDPTYVGGEWLDDDDLDKVFGNTVILTRKDGTEVELEKMPYMSSGCAEGFVPFSWEEPFTFDGERVTKNQLRALGRLREVTPPTIHDYSYAGCCSVSSSEGQGGQLNYRRGHPGAGVCVSSGYGDGLYAVYVKYNKDGRVAQMMVDFMHDAD